jgi:hypothetical protein
MQSTNSNHKTNGLTLRSHLIFSNIQMSFPTLRKTLEKPWNIAVCDQTIDEVTLKVGQDPEFHIHSRFLGVVGKRASAPPRG